MPSEYPVRIVQFGEGVFLRGFMNWMIARMNESAGFGASACVVKPRPGDFPAAFRKQNNRYTIVFKGMEGGGPCVRRESNDTIARLVRPHGEFGAFLEEADNPGLFCVVSNTTEAGIAHAAADRAEDRPASSFPGKLTQFLRRRYETFRGAPGKGLIVLPCELIESNGAALREIVLEHARRWYRDGRFEDWVRDANLFLDTLVDRIVSGYSEEERRSLREETGFDDALVVVAEPYHLLAIRGPESLERVLPFRQSGLNVVWTEDITPYRTLKVRLLNGNHTFMAMCGLGAGFGNILDCMRSPWLRDAVRAANELELLPCMPFPAEESGRYLETVFRRFENPFLDHRLENTALNGVAKWKTRLLPPLLDYHARTGSAPVLLSFSLAALAVRYATADSVRDDPAAVSFFKSLADGMRNDPDSCAREIAGNAALWGESLAPVAGFSAVLASQIRDILSSGMEKALAGAVEAARRREGA
ncbi:MAG: tagaturonate reductase [Syntrophobacteraceae bacterium]|nr:tagaturonate reductase [Desulfobacteraceae bacterium]